MIKRVFKSFTFYFLLVSLLIIYMHYIGQDSKSIVLIGLNPILNSLANTSFAHNILDSGFQVSCNTIMGTISIYWYLAHFITFGLFGVILDSLKLIIKRLDKY